jgi:hypothetical protein
LLDTCHELLHLTTKIQYFFVSWLTFALPRKQRGRTCRFCKTFTSELLEPLRRD